MEQEQKEKEKEREKDKVSLLPTAAPTNMDADTGNTREIIFFLYWTLNSNLTLFCPCVLIQVRRYFQSTHGNCHHLVTC